MKKVVIVTLLGCLAALAGTFDLNLTAFSHDARPAAAGDSILTIPAAAFNEEEDGYDFYRADQLYFNSGSGFFSAPVNLPNGSVIKKVILICWDNGAEYFYLVLSRVSQSGGSELIDSVSSSGADTGYRTFSKTLTSKKYVNTWKHSHYLRLIVPGTSFKYSFSQAKIIYTPPSP